MSLFVLYFGTDRDYAGRVAHHTVAFGPRYQGLLRDIFGGARDACPTTSACTCTRPRSPTRRWRRPAAASFYVLSPVPHLGHASLDWDKIAGATATASWPRSSRSCPTSAATWWCAAASPRRLPVRARAYLGSAFSCAPRLGQSAYFRPHNRDPRIPGLYLVGAGTHPGAGVPGVVNSARRPSGSSPTTSRPTSRPTWPATAVARGRAPDAPRADGVPA